MEPRQGSVVVQKRFPHDDRAVSPVVGTIIMIAITVVLAGTIFVIAQQLRDDVSRDDYPNIQFVSNEAQNTLTVHSIKSWTGGELRWSDTVIDDATVLVDGCSDVNGNPLDGTDLVSVGDVLHCNAGKVTISYPATNQVIFLKDFL